MRDSRWTTTRAPIVYQNMLIMKLLARFLWHHVATCLWPPHIRIVTDELIKVARVDCLVHLLELQRLAALVL